MPESPRPVLIVSASGRALARSARRAAWTPWVLDLFADSDTCRLAAACRRIPAGPRGFDPVKLAEAATALDPRRRAAIAYGSGLEASPELIDALAAGRRLIGNSAEVVDRVKDPAWLARQLGELGIPHPETRGNRPEIVGGWLEKDRGGSGGLHVLPARPGKPNPSARTYFQRRVEGRVLGVTFLAARGEALVAGFAEQLVYRLDERHPFVFSGSVAVAAESLPAQLRTSMGEALGALTAAAGLQGLCGVDLIQDGERWWLIDVNPRPAASFALHEGKDSLFASHVDAVVNRRLRFPCLRGVPLRGFKVVYADRELRVPSAWQWPRWVSDRPWPGTQIGSGEPVCSVRASAASGEATRALLEMRSQHALRMLEKWQPSRRSA